MEPVSAPGLRSVLGALQVSAQVLEQVQAEDVADASNLRLLDARFARWRARELPRSGRR
jgi:hypothetical protein